MQSSPVNLNCSDSNSRPVFVIAEAGVNHNGDASLACDMIDAAAECGADAVKFQTFQPDRLVSSRASKAAYQLRNTSPDESQLEMIRRLHLDVAAHERLCEHCANRGIAFLSSPFDLESIELLVRLGLKTFKIPSGEITNLPYLRKTAQAASNIILSTGMSDLQEVSRALATLIDAGADKDRITVLHCNTEYPTPMHDVNLRAMLTMREAFGTRVGFSDHTLGIEASIAAVAMGASIIEKHFTLDRILPGPDHRASLEPAELKAMIRAVRNVELALGDGIKKPSQSELSNISITRKSIVAARPIPCNATITADMLAVKRPGTGIAPGHLDELAGLTAATDIHQDQVLTWELLSTASK